MSLCSYCGPRTGARAVHKDHIASKSERRSLPKEWETETVGACMACNTRKLSRRLVPPGYPSLEELRELTGKVWAEWDGNPASSAFLEVLR